MNAHDPMIDSRIGMNSLKAAALLLMLSVVNVPADAQFVDILLDVRSRIDVREMTTDTTLQPDLLRSVTLKDFHSKIMNMCWLRIRTSENMVLKVEVKYHDLPPDPDGASVAFLNTGSSTIREAQRINSHQLTFPVNSSNRQMTRSRSQPEPLEAWLGIPAGKVRELVIEYH